MLLPSLSRSSSSVKKIKNFLLSICRDYISDFKRKCAAFVTKTCNFHQENSLPPRSSWKLIAWFAYRKPLALKQASDLQEKGNDDTSRPRRKLKWLWGSFFSFLASSTSSSSTSSCKLTTGLALRMFRGRVELEYDQSSRDSLVPYHAEYIREPDTGKLTVGRACSQANRLALFLFTIIFTFSSSLP